MALVAFAVFIAASGGTLAPSTFEGNDGNLVVDTPGNKDWANAPNLVTATDKPTGQQDDSFGQGTKEDTPVPTVVDGSIPNNKSDLLRFYVANEKADSKEFLYLAWVRANTLGTANMDFEFNQSTATSGNGVTPVRTAGDVLITFDFASGGNKVELALLRWITSGSTSQCEASNTLPCWGNKIDLDAAGFAEGAVNNGFSVFDPIANATLATQTFGEASINLTDAGVFPPDACVNFGRAHLASRSSDSFTAAMKDFIAPIPVNIRNCGRIIIRKQTDPDGAAGTFSYTTTGGLSPSSFTLSDNGVQDYGETVKSGSYTVTEASPSPAFDLVDITCSATAGSSATTNLATGTVSISLAANGVVDCTYTNRQRGTIIVEKQTDPDGSSATFDFTGNAAGTIGDGGTITVPNLVPGTYTSTEAEKAGWDLVSVACNDSDSTGDVPTRTATFRLSAGETVKCTFTNRQRGRIDVLKTDDAGNALAGAVFTLFTDNAPLDGPAPHGAEDTSTGLSCTTGSDGRCSIGNVVPGQYWLVETTGVPGHESAADQNVVVGAGATVSLTFVNPRLHTVIVIVCHEGTNTLAPSQVTNGASSGVSLASPPAGITEAQLCALGGARFEGKPHGPKSLTVDVGSNAH